jgi:hypothetical protein
MDEEQPPVEVPMSAARLLVERIAERQALARVYQAEQLEYIDALRLQYGRGFGADWHDPDSLEWRELRAEVAAVLQVHERTAQSMLLLARSLVHVFPSTLSLLRQAEFSDRHARVLVEHSHGLAAELIGEYEARLLEFVDLPVSRFDRMARKIRADLQPQDLIEKHREALTERRTAVEPAGDGMAWYGAYMSAEYVIGAAASVTGLAKGLMIEGETRTLQQIEADVFRDLLIDAGGVTAPAVEGDSVQATPAARRGINPQVSTTVPVLTAMGRSDEPGLLEGYGPIDADTARRIAGEAPGWIRILTDPEDGAVTSFGRTTYKVPKQLRRSLQARDEVCRFVGCTRSVAGERLAGRDPDLDVADGPHVHDETGPHLRPTRPHHAGTTTTGDESLAPGRRPVLNPGRRVATKERIESLAQACAMGPGSSKRSASRPCRCALDTLVPRYSSRLDTALARLLDDRDPAQRPGTAPGALPRTMGTRTALPHSVHEPS